MSKCCSGRPQRSGARIGRRDQDGLRRRYAQLFQLTPSRVGTLIANTRARFGDSVEHRARTAAVHALTTRATKLDDDTIRVVLDPSLGRYVKELVDQTEAPPLEKSKTASRTYDIGRDTIVGICERLGIPPSDVEVLNWP